MDVERLIMEVEAHPILYDKTRSDFKMTWKRDESWQEISELLGKDVDYLKKKFKNLRDTFFKVYKMEKLNISGSSYKLPVKWPYYKQMKFVLPFNQSAVERIQSGRATQEQFSTMVEFFIENKSYADGNLNSIRARRKWKELTEELNNITSGVRKSAAQWQIVWRDLKLKTASKSRDLKRARALTKNKRITTPSLSELEMNIMDIIGTVENNEKNQTNIKIEWENENNDDNLMEGFVDIANISDSEDHEIQQNTIDENRDIFEMATVPEVVFSDGISDTELTESPQQSAPVKSNKTSSVNLRKRTREKRLTGNVQLSTIQYQNIAEKQTDVMEKLANASKMIAEAAIIQAEAMTKIGAAITSLTNTAALQATNEEHRTRVMEKLLTVLENIFPTQIQDQTTTTTTTTG